MTLEQLYASQQEWKKRAETAESELLDIKAVLANAEIEERADQDIMEKAEQRADEAEARCKALESAVYGECSCCVHRDNRYTDYPPCGTCFNHEEYHFKPGREEADGFIFDIERFGGKK